MDGLVVVEFVFYYELVFVGVECGVLWCPRFYIG